MARLAPIRLAGMIAATATCAAAATSVPTPTWAQDRPLVLNEQIQFGDVISEQRLDVVDLSDQATVSTYAAGNDLSGGTDGQDASVRSYQEMRGGARADTTMTFGGDTQGYVSATTQARGNSLSISAYEAELAVEAEQVQGPGEIGARTVIEGEDTRLIGGARLDASAIANAAAVGGQTTFISGTIDQSSDAGVRSASRIEGQYVPAEGTAAAQSLANAVQATGYASSGQALVTRQSSTGDVIDADASANAGNGWTLTSQANAGANQATFANAGGSVLIEADQTASSAVTAQAVATAYDYGAATATARAVANEVSAGNNDIYVEIDNAQLNTGGVEATAYFSGTNGYDAYVGAEAAGNAVTAFACSTCEGYLEATNSQTNDGSVTASANTTVAGQGRAVITSSTAVGNSATFYVSRPGQ
jgi:hypothetical protein